MLFDRQLRSSVQNCSSVAKPWGRLIALLCITRDNQLTILHKNQIFQRHRDIHYKRYLKSMQLSQSFSFGKSYFKGGCASLIVVGVSGSIIFNRLEPLLIPLAIIPIAARKYYVDSKKEQEILHSRINTLESESAYYLELEQQHKFIVLELQEENDRLKEAFDRDKKLIQKLEQKISSLQKSIATVEETIQYYESEIVDENHTLEKKNKSLKHTVEKLQLQQEIIQEEYEFLQQEKANILSELTRYQLQHQITEEKPEVRTIDLSDRKLAIVGGHPRVQNAVVDALDREYNLGEVIKFTSNDREKRITQQHIKDALKSCDYIVMITGNLSGYIQRTVKNLKNNGHLNGDILTITESRGESGVLREIKQFLDVNSN